MCGGSVSFLSPRKWVNEVGNLVENVGEMAENILKDPLPTIATIALTAVGVPYPVAAAAVTAAQGGSIEDIAISAGTAYVGQQVGVYAGEVAGELAGEAISESTKQLITQVVTQASGPAAVVALRGGSFQDILEAGVAGGVSGALSNTLRTEFNMDPKALDTKLISNATNAATRAVLQGKSISDAVMNAAAVTAISSTIEGQTNKLLSNNATLGSVREKFDSLKQAASDFFTGNNIEDLQAEAQSLYQTADELRNEYSGVKSEYDQKMALYNDAKNSNNAEAANALVPEIDRLGGILNEKASGVNAATDAFNAAFERLNPLSTQYQDYINQLNSLAGTASTIAEEQENLAKEVGVNTIKYQETILGERAKLLEDIDKKSLIEATKEIDTQQQTQTQITQEQLDQFFRENPTLALLGDEAKDILGQQYAEDAAKRAENLRALTEIGPPEIQAFDDGSFQALYGDGTIKVFDDEGALFRTINEGDTNYEDYALGIKENTKLFGNIGNTPEEAPKEAKPGGVNIGRAISSLLSGTGRSAGDIGRAALIGTVGAGVINELTKSNEVLAAQGLQSAITPTTATRQANVAPEGRRAGSTFFEFVSPVQYGQTTPTQAVPTTETATTAEAAPVVQAAEGGLMNMYDPTSAVQMFNTGGIPSAQDTYAMLIKQGFTPEQAKAYISQQMLTKRPSRSRQDTEDKRKERQQGLMALAKGGNLPARYLNGATDGMADKIPAKIGKKQPAALSHGEFVIPADVVSHLGNGNSEAGAKVLYDMMAKIRKARTGNTKQGKEINPAKFMPKG
jgi:regulator of replication initiation timing